MSARLMTTQEVADKIQIPTPTLRKWRSQGRGPKGFRVGRHVRYRLEDVETWLDAQYTADTKVPVTA